MTRPSVRTHERNTRNQPPHRRTGQRAPLAWPHHCFPRDAGGNRTHLNRVAAGRLAIWLQRQVVSVLAGSRTWSSTFAGSRANPPHSEDVSSFSALPRNRTSSGSFEDCHARPAHPQGLRCQCLDQESDLDLDLRRVLCDPLHHRDVQTRADDWICTSIERFTGPLPFCSATSASTSARSRTPCGRVGACLLSQEHTRVSPPAREDRGLWRNDYFCNSTFQ